MSLLGDLHSLEKVRETGFRICFVAGFISEDLPSDLPIILGLWDDINSLIRFG